MHGLTCELMVLSELLYSLTLHEVCIHLIYLVVNHLAFHTKLLNITNSFLLSV